MSAVSEVVTIGAYQALHLVRDRVLLLWTLGLPVILSLIFSSMFSGMDELYQADPVELGVVLDEPYRDAEGLEEVVTAVSSQDGDMHLVNTHPVSSPAEAEDAALEGETIGYLAVEDDEPVLHVSPASSDEATVPVLRAVLESYLSTRAEYAALTTRGVGPEQMAATQVSRTHTQEVQVTQEPADPQVRFYYALLAFACGTGAAVSVIAAQGVVATSSPLGARRSLAGTARWRVLLGTLVGSWVCIVACLLIAFYVIRAVADISFGPSTWLCHLAIAVASLMTCAAGAALGTVRGMNLGIVSGNVALLSLLTGLYGPGAQQLADTVEQSAPLLAQANPLWQIARSFFALLYYDSLEPFARCCAVMGGMTLLFLAVALVRMRRLSHEHL
ncbi:ABC transporter permease [Actinomyces wuliandei]|uniref:ABC transporter permease n=1 Tax=Actinomyces wuliandei TaxID=2057743 RepID=UPI000FDC843F|nr:ABC transporter permease [Actinomyces wuliandei]